MMFCTKPDGREGWLYEVYGGPTCVERSRPPAPLTTLLPVGNALGLDR